MRRRRRLVGRCRAATAIERPKTTAAAAVAVGGGGGWAPKAIDAVRRRVGPHAQNDGLRGVHGTHVEPV
jgi:hypothetical protein